MTSSGWTGRSFTTCGVGVYPPTWSFECRTAGPNGWDGRMKVTTDKTEGEGHLLSTEHVHEEESKHWLWGHFCITCMLGRGRGRVPAHDLRSSSRARLSISNCLSCSRTEASREAVLTHCSIHTLRVEQRTGQGRINTRELRTLHQHQHLLQGQVTQSTDRKSGAARSEVSASVKVLKKKKKKLRLKTSRGWAWVRKTARGRQVPRAQSRRKEDEQGKQESVIFTSY